MPQMTATWNSGTRVGHLDTLGHRHAGEVLRIPRKGCYVLRALGQRPGARLRAFLGGQVRDDMLYKTKRSPLRITRRLVPNLLPQTPKTQSPKPNPKNPVSVSKEATWSLQVRRSLSRNFSPNAGFCFEGPTLSPFSSGVPKFYLEDHGT